MPVTPDPRWLEILKASGWQAAAIAVACASILLLNRWHWIPALDSWMIIGATFGLLVAGALSLASVLSGLFNFFPAGTWLVRWINKARMRRAVSDYIPHMTPIERQIISYLLAHNQKMFTAEQDGGYATTLQSRGIVVVALRPGQIFSGSDMPMAIPDEVWNVLVKHKDKFPITDAEKNGPHPWRVPWQLR